MELTMRVVIMAVLVLVAALISATLIMGWGADAMGWSKAVVGPLQDMIMGR